MDEMHKIARYLQLSFEEFCKKYVRKVGNRYSLLEKPRSYDCVFLKDKKCEIYPVRPIQCQTFPYWPEVLESPETWRETARGCEGIRHDAPTVPKEEIDLQLQRQLESDA
jgi:Fe-S-cluster containining protein